jgi:hypothetical protein
LLTIARGDSPYVIFLMIVVLERLQNGGFAAVLGDFGIVRFVMLQINELIDDKAGAERAFDAVKRMAGLLPRFHFLAVFVPEIRG